MIWGDFRVDVWFYGILLIDLVATYMLFTKSRRWRLLQLSILVNTALWIAYERAISEYLSLSVPIRLDFPFVAVLAFYPVYPSCIFARRLRRILAENNSVEQAAP
jgi:hypothetical protein